MKLLAFIEALKKDARTISGEENPEIEFVSTINGNEVCRGEYDGVFFYDGTNTVCIDIAHKEV